MAYTPVPQSAKSICPQEHRMSKDLKLWQQPENNGNIFSYVCRHKLAFQNSCLAKSPVQSIPAAELN